MNQISLSQTGFELSAKTTRKRIFLDEMQRIKWFGLSDPAMEEALHDTPIYREFAGLDAGISRIPDETTILRFRRLLEEHQLADQILGTVNAILVQAGFLLKAGKAVDATLIPAPSSTKNNDGARDPEMTFSKKGNKYHFGMKAHIGVDIESGLVHTSTGSSHDVTQAHELLHGEERMVFADSGYRGVTKRDEIKAQEHQPEWHLAMMPSKRKALDKGAALDALYEKLEKLNGEAQSKRTRQDGASVFGHQVPVALQKNTVQGLVQKHDADRDAVCTVQLMDGKTRFDQSIIASAGISA